MSVFFVGVFVGVVAPIGVWNWSVARRLRWSFARQRPVRQKTLRSFLQLFFPIRWSGRDAKVKGVRAVGVRHFVTAPYSLC